ncbi:Sensory subunit of low CO2-induced protein complex, putative [hydrothermal vent metagenome]|uniref:Sensory subunit of low CO2-induced protein complex, putative n=1 Tax=hydrothermal vent metagenome TaxID=652676 RepID=A0A3B1BTE7_9ZZZZ
MIKKTAIFFLMIFLISACNSGENQEATRGTSSNFEKNTPKGQASYSDDVSAKNILQVAMSSPDHTTLVAAVQAAEIEHVLVNAGPLTVFAPTNAAFDALPEGTVETLLKPENKSKLAFILTNHAAPGSFNIEALKKEARKGRKIYTAAGDYLEIKVDGDDVYVGGAKVLASIQTSNGVIDVVDKVILPSEN